MITVYCAECGAELDRKESDIATSKTGLFFCNKTEAGRYYRRTGRSKPIPQQRGWRRSVPA